VWGRVMKYIGDKIDKRGGLRSILMAKKVKGNSIY